MKRLFAVLSIGLALSASAAAFAFVPVAQAQFEPPSGTVSQAAVAANAAKIQPGQGDTTGAQTAAAKKALPPNVTPQPCSGLSSFSCIPGAIMTEIASLFAWLLGVAMIVLDATVYYTVVKMGSILSQANGIGAIPLVWRIMRDFGNIALIFGFLAIGLETILGVDFYGGGTKLLPTLVIVAVLLNFSLFLASAVVDVSNLFATEFYSQINNGAIPAPPSFDNFSTAVHEEGVSNAIMSQLGMQTLYGAAMNAGTSQTGSSPSTIFSGSNSFFIGFLSSVLFIVAAFVMFSLSIILVTRFVVLILLLVVSPIGVASFAIPQLKSLGKKWRDTLLEQSMTAPVLILLLYVALRVITDVHFLSTFVAGGNSATAASNLWTGFVNAGSSGSNLTGFAGVLLSFIVAMGLLLAVTMAAKSMSAAGAGFATKVGGKLSGLTLAAAAPGYLGRNTAGRFSQRLGERWSKSKYARIPGLGSRVSSVLDKGAKASYDVRPAKDSKFLSGAGINLGKKQKGGFAAEEKAAIEKHEKYAKTLKMTKPEEARKKELEVAQKSEQEEQGKAEKRAREVEQEHKDQLRDLYVRQQVDLKPATDEIAARRAELAAAERTGVRADIDGAQLALNNSLRARDVARDEQRKEEEALKREHSDALNSLRNEADVHKAVATHRGIEAESMGKKPQEQYADNISDKSIWPLGGWQKRNMKAAENIKKEAKKKKSDKEIEALRKAMEKAESEPGGR